MDNLPLVLLAVAVATLIAAVILRAFDRKPRRHTCALCEQDGLPLTLGLCADCRTGVRP
ncbi:hypothetical protein [Actinoplanes teichomyceticus]|uniref:hypothetical protein n=1 Tax=Actinoplanes teichomyceticus TaxID=1867 RepID=UPI0013DDE2F9|nr:hypothetical protein [Actinoplanes teichomyceticus]